MFVTLSLSWKVAGFDGKNGIENRSEAEWIRAKSLSGNIYWKGRKRCSLEGRGDKKL
jgi:hypothetical protein